MKKVKRAKITKSDTYHIFAATKLDTVLDTKLKSEAQKRDIARGTLIRLAIAEFLSDSKQPA